VVGYVGRQLAPPARALAANPRNEVVALRMQREAAGI
jgi:hypothetical protein